ncbi:peptidase S8/S53 domain-containing protein [Bisporella sp. PMI_857]|nr:peptidase S8/S53 domain-containing protein [Bisporella sp. PMI_857]
MRDYDYMSHSSSNHLIQWIRNNNIQEALSIKHDLGACVEGACTGTECRNVVSGDLLETEENKADSTHSLHLGMHLQIVFVSVALAAAVGSAYQIFETIPRVPHGWTQRDKANPNKILQLRLALQMPDEALFEQTIYDVSTPGHHRYGKHLNHEEVRALVRPRDSSVALVLSWLERSGATHIERDNEWVIFSIAVADADSMLNTEFHYFTSNADVSTKIIRTLTYSIPKHIFDHVAMIEPTTKFGQMNAQRISPFHVEHYTEGMSSQNSTSCDGTITPQCLRSIYNIGNYYADPASRSLLGVSGFLNQFAKYEALDVFYEKYAPYASDQNFSYVLINGGLSTQNDPKIDDTEANLDMQYAASLAYKTNITFYSTGGLGPLVPNLDQPDATHNQNEPYLEFLTYLIKQPQELLPQTITTSYGEDEQSVPLKYSKTVCNLFGTLGLRGVSVIFSSGDTGVGSACQTNDGKNTTRFSPVFPATCPFVTSVGGTYQINPEVAISFSSGGFSDRWETPTYQKSHVQDYLMLLGKQWHGLYNPKGRGFPDVAAQSSRFHVVEKAGQELLIGGTSASAPVFAAIISLLNNARLSAGQTPLGFLNPWLYSLAGIGGGLTDITQGGSRGCTGRDIYSGLPTPKIPYASWNATPGWDPVTGLGTPNFERLLQIALPDSKLERIKRRRANGD